jgi:long-chain-fatty-acid--CoA ligase ACSBG
MDNLKDFSPILQISTETMIEKINKNDINNLLYTTNIKQELPIFISETGMGSVKPLTIMELFEQVTKEEEKEEALFTEVNGVMTGITWYQYHKKVQYFAKALISIGVEPYKTVNILGYNSMEWFISYLGGMYSCVPPVGVYPTNSSDACLYIAEHSECGCLILDSLNNFKKYEKDLKRLKYLKAIVFYCEFREDELRSLTNSFVAIYQWKDFISLGKRSMVELEFSNRIRMQKPGNCCNLIYTSGTTGNPKGVMLSHDNLTWTARALESTYGQLIGYKGRLVSFLPLSHIAGQVVDILRKKKSYNNIK